MPNPRVGDNSEDTWEWHLSFIGQHMQHNYRLYYLLDDIIGNNQQIKSIVELGTGYGALTLALGLHALKMDVPILTIDIRDDLCVPVLPLFEKIGIDFYKGDAFTQEVSDKIVSIVGNLPTYIICDNGNKVREFRYWAPKIPSGSVISAHDWLTEINMKDVQDIVDVCLEPYSQDRWVEMNVRFATFRKL